MVKLSYNHLLFNTQTKLDAPGMDLRLSPSESYRAIVLSHHRIFIFFFYLTVLV